MSSLVTFPKISLSLSGATREISAASSSVIYSLPLARSIRSSLVMTLFLALRGSSGGKAKILRRVEWS